MDIAAANEKQLLADIDRQREEFTLRHHMYLNACVQLFLMRKLPCIGDTL